MTAHPGRRAHWSPLAGLLACAIPLLPSALEAQTSQLIWENEYADGATATPVTIGGTTVSIAGLDPLGIGVGGNFTVQHATWGGHAGYWESGVDATSQAQSLTFRLTFSQPVESLSFSLLDIDTNGSFHDSITVVGWESTTPFSPTTVFLGPAVISPAPGIYAGQANVETTSTDGNVDLRFDQPVDSVTFEYGPGPRAATDPALQVMGLSDLTWTIPCGPPPTVSTTAELRAAVADSCASLILLNPGTYDLTASGSGELFIDQGKTLRNAGGGEVIIDAAGASRAIRITTGNTVELDGLTITGGNSGGANGGGILTDGDLTIRNSTITGNSTGVDGAGLYMATGSLLMENVTVSGNTATSDGGGLDVTDATQLIHVTVANNSAGNQGGGIRSRNAAVQLVNSLVGDNVSGSGGQIANQITSLGINLAEGGCLGCRAIDLTGDPLLLPLALNGGDSRTHALDGPSIARDTADAAFGLPTDQRGVSRPVASGYDIGAFEASPAPFGISVDPDALAIQRSTGSQQTQDFDVVNESTTTESVTLTGSVGPAGSSFLTVDSLTGPGVAGAGASASVTIGSGATATVTVWYTVATAPVGTVDTLRLTGDITVDPRYTDDGWAEIEWVCAPTTSVTTTAELRAAVADPCVSTILLTPGLYDLTASGSGELFIDQDKTLRNAGGGEVIIDAAGASRVIRAEPGNVIELDGLRITGGVSGNDGGGIRADADPLTIRNSTITGNSSTGGHGGGLFMNGGGLLLENVTISGNTASGNGGGLDIRTNAQLVHVTVANNTADEGGGLDPRNNTVQLVNSIVADNISTGGGGQIRREITSLGINLVEDGCVGCRAIDLTGDPLLLPLALNGGDSRTHALDGPSIARDTADVAFALATDQRGVSRPVAFGYDLGAYEAAQAPYGIKLSPNGLAIQRGPGTEYQQDFDVVNRSMTAEDIDLTGTVQPVGSFLTIDSITGTGVIGSGATATVNVASLATTTITAWFSAVTAPLGQIDTLRLAGEIVSDPRYTDDGWVEVEQVCTPTSSVSTTAQLRNAVTDGCVGLILLTPGTYDLTVSGTGELFIDQNKTLRNAGGGEVIIDAAGASRVIHIDQNDVTVELDGLTITGGVSGADGGGVRTDGNNGTSVTIRNSTITGNATTGHGGGLFMNGGGLLLENVTVSGNTASGNGGGLDVRTTAQLVHVTVANNTADEGGGLDPRNSTVQLVNSIVADNTSTGGGGQIRRELTSVGINLVEGGCVGCLPSDLTGDPLLLPLALNGGDSRTHALDGPSIARDTADVAFALATDQRGVSRPQGVGYDLGAYEAELSISATMVAAASAANRLPSNGTGYQESFTLTNSGAGSSAFTLRATAAGSAVVVDSIRGPGLTFGAQPDSALTATLAGNGGSVAVAVFYTVPDISAGTTDTLILTATSVVSPMLSVTDSTTVTVVRPSLSLGKTATVTGDTIPGADVTYQITVTNLGTEAAVQVVVRDSIPVEVDYRLGSTSETLPPGVTAVVEFDDGTDTWTYAPVSEGCGAPVGYDGCVRYTRWPLDNPLPQTAPDNVAVFSFVARIR
ncbi:MAG: DUF4139 domain-containing protein [Gemmatimonadota bacterium]|nr:DUF4139 domain-containing protein [Gemmatimonadota bacterium]